MTRTTLGNASCHPSPELTQNTFQENLVPLLDIVTVTVTGDHHLPWARQ